MNVLNDLLDYNLKIVQNDNFFKFSIDSVMLAEFININLSDKKLLDLCTGNAPLPLIMANKIKEIYAIEIQKDICELAIESIKINNIKNIKVINDDIKNTRNYFPGNNFDIITCNPPYFKYSKDTLISISKEKSIARHEIKIKLEEIIQIAYNNLRSSGKFYIVHRAERLIEIIELLTKYKFGIKCLQFVYHDQLSECSMVLIEAKKNNKNNIKILPPIFVKNYRRIS